MSIGLVTAAYVVAAILFILALGGLSNQEKAKRAIWYGIIGMALAVGRPWHARRRQLWLILLMIVVGGAGGWYVANKVQMTQMPELVAGFHSLVGLAAVFIGFNADIEMNARWRPRKPAPWRSWRASRRPSPRNPRRDQHPEGRAVPRHLHRRDHLHRLDRRLWQAGGQDLVLGADAALPPSDQPRGRRSSASCSAFCTCTCAGRLSPDLPDPGRRHRRRGRLAPDHGDRRRGHAGRGLHAQLVFGLGGGGDRLHAGQRSADRGRRAGRRLGRDPQPTSCARA